MTTHGARPPFNFPFQLTYHFLTSTSSNWIRSVLLSWLYLWRIQYCHVSPGQKSLGSINPSYSYWAFLLLSTELYLKKFDLTLLYRIINRVASVLDFLERSELLYWSPTILLSISWTEKLRTDTSFLKCLNIFLSEKPHNSTNSQIFWTWKETKGVIRKMVAWVWSPERWVDQMKELATVSGVQQEWNLSWHEKYRGIGIKTDEKEMNYTSEARCVREFLCISIILQVAIKVLIDTPSGKECKESLRN